jgi:hypothetical protein
VTRVSAEGLAVQGVGQLGATADAELGVHTLQMVLDGARREVELRSNG